MTLVSSSPEVPRGPDGTGVSLTLLSPLLPLLPPLPVQGLTVFKHEHGDFAAQYIQHDQKGLPARGTIDEGNPEPLRCLLCTRLIQWAGTQCHRPST